MHDLRHPQGQEAAADRGLDREAVARAAGLEPSRVQIVEVTGSTNQDLMDAPAERDPLAPRVLIAVRQSEGRGRRGRAWLSDPADCLTMSISVHRAREAFSPALTGLPIALGVAVAETLAAEAPGVGLKWPNDLLRDGRKCAGLLVQVRAVGALERLVIGLGLNWRLPRSLALSDRQRQVAQTGQPPPLPAGGLFEELPPAAVRERIAGALARALVERACRFMSEGFRDTAREWALYDFLSGRQVVVHSDAGPALAGVAEGLGADGALRVRTVGGVRAVSAGEVSVRLAASACAGSAEA